MGDLFSKISRYFIPTSAEQQKESLRALLKHYCSCEITTHSTILSNGNEIVYIVIDNTNSNNTNDEEDRVLVMTHAFGSGIGFFYANYDFLSTKFDKIYSLDWSGMGASSRDMPAASKNSSNVGHLHPHHQHQQHRNFSNHNGSKNGNHHHIYHYDEQHAVQPPTRSWFLPFLVNILPIYFLSMLLYICPWLGSAFAYYIVEKLHQLQQEEQPQQQQQQHQLNGDDVDSVDRRFLDKTNKPQRRNTTNNDDIMLKYASLLQQLQNRNDKRNKDDNRKCDDSSSESSTEAIIASNSRLNTTERCTTTTDANNGTTITTETCATHSIHTTTTHTTHTTKCVNFFIDNLELFRHQVIGDEVRFLLAGHSIGGYLSTRYSLKYPRYVKGLILISPCGMNRLPARHTHLPVYHVSWKLSLITSLVSLNITPQGLARLMGSFGPGIVKKVINLRFKNRYSGTELDLLADYSYHITAAPGCGEYSLYSLLEFICASKTEESKPLTGYGSTASTSETTTATTTATTSTTTTTKTITASTATTTAGLYAREPLHAFIPLFASPPPPAAASARTTITTTTTGTATSTTDENDSLPESGAFSSPVAGTATIAVGAKAGSGTSTGNGRGIPIFIAYGDRDWMKYKDIESDVAYWRDDCAVDISLYIVPNAGHHVSLDNSEGFHLALDSWLTEKAFI